MSRVNPDGPIPCDLALFGEKPGYEEQMEGKGFVGKSGKQLWADVKRFTGLSRSAFYVSNLVKDGSARNTPPKPSEIAAALPEFLDELDRVQPHVVVTAGAHSTRAMLGNVKMADVHGIPHEAEVGGSTYLVMPIYHPAAGLHNKGFLAAFAYDLGRFSALLRGGLKPWTPGLPVRTSWLSRDAVRRCEVLQAGVAAVDTEGWEARPWGLSFSLNGRDGYVIRADDAEGLDWFLQWGGGRWRVVMHNGLHDLPVLRAMGVHMGEYDDTQVLGYHDIIRTGSGILEAESQNLGTLAYRECGMRLGELTDLPGVDLAARTIPYTDDVMRYASEDAVATWRLFAAYQQRGLTDYPPYQIDMGQVALVEQMVRTGIPFDVEATTDYYADVGDKLAACTADLRKTAARYGNRDFNPGSHPQVRDIITKRIGLRIRKRTKGGLASTNEKALADHQDHAFVKQLQTHRELVKLKGTYLIPLLQEIV